MNEQINIEPTEEELEQQRQVEVAARYMAEIDREEALPKTRREAGQEIVELEGLFAAFEATHSLESLHAIIDLSEFVPVVINEAKGTTVLRHPMREPAQLALKPIVEKLNALSNETNISQQKLAELRVTYRRLLHAVGRINNGRIIHDRG